jgi:hypothetical protein
MGSVRSIEVFVVAKVIIDITGFYFSIEVEAKDGDTVLDVMRKAEAASGGGTKPVMRFMSTSDGSISRAIA